MPVNSNKIFQKYPNRFFVETGTFQGKGLAFAVSCDFEKFFSIEVCKINYDNCCKKFQHEIADGKLELFLGASEDVLWDVIKDIDEPITFWLDAHYSGKTKAYVTGKSDVNSPLFREINVIAKHPIKTHTIMVDDRRDFGTNNFNFVTEKQVVDAIKSINPKYEISYNTGHDGDKMFQNDVLVARVM